MADGFFGQGAALAQLGANLLGAAEVEKFQRLERAMVAAANEHGDLATHQEVDQILSLARAARGRTPPLTEDQWTALSEAADKAASKRQPKLRKTFIIACNMRLQDLLRA